MSDSLLWELTKTQNSFLVKRNGAQFSRDPMNVANLHAFKYSGVNSKAIGVKAVGDRVVLSTKKFKNESGSKPKSQLANTTFKTLTNTPTGNKAAKSIMKQTAGKFYRADLALLAVGRYHALARAAVRKAQGVKPSINKRAKKVVA